MLFAAPTRAGRAQHHQRPRGNHEACAGAVHRAVLSAGVARPPSRARAFPGGCSTYRNRLSDPPPPPPITFSAWKHSYSELPPGALFFSQKKKSPPRGSWGNFEIDYGTIVAHSPKIPNAKWFCRPVNSIRAILAAFLSVSRWSVCLANLWFVSFFLKPHAIDLAPLLLLSLAG